MHTEIYPIADKEMFTEYLYPYLLDSLGFPAEMQAVAKKLDPGCSVESGDAHYQIKVTANGQTKVYGGMGTGGSKVIFSDLIGKDYNFGGNDLCAGGINALHDKYLAYVSASNKIYKEAGLEAKINQDAVDTVIAQSGGGAWLMVAIEGTNSDGYAYAYRSRPTSEARYASNCWVDDRYVNKYEGFRKGQHFKDHPKMDIIEGEKTYGNKTVARLYRYYEALDIWIDSVYLTSRGAGYSAEQLK